MQSGAESHYEGSEHHPTKNPEPVIWLGAFPYAACLLKRVF
jgi:hypothetical protein